MILSSNRKSSSGKTMYVWRSIRFCNLFLSVICFLHNDILLIYSTNLLDEKVNFVLNGNRNMTDEIEVLAMIWLKHLCLTTFIEEIKA